jgi:hypothetical protein
MQQIYMAKQSRWIYRIKISKKITVKLNSFLDKNEYNLFLNEIYSYESYRIQLEVNFEYPEHLHDLHNDFQFAPEHRKIDKVDKLLATLHNKYEYSINIKLCLFLKLGLRVTKVHKVIQFD